MSLLSFLLLSHRLFSLRVDISLRLKNDVLDFTGLPVKRIRHIRLSPKQTLTNAASTVRDISKIRLIQSTVGNISKIGFTQSIVVNISKVGLI